MPYYRRIRELREDNDLTQQKLAEILQMKQPQYFRYEQGFRDIPTDILKVYKYSLIANNICICSHLKI